MKAIIHTTVRALNARPKMAAFFLALILVGGPFMQATPRTPKTDERSYLTTALTLYETGVFSRQKAENGQPEPDMFFAPLTPAIYAAGLAADPAFRKTVQCLAAHDWPRTPGACPPDYGGFLFFQAALATLALFLLFPLARAAGFSRPVAFGGLVLTGASGIHAYYAGRFLTETYVFLAAAAFLLFLVKTLKTRHPAHAAAAGLAVGVAALTRPSYAYLAYACVAGLLLWPLWQRRRRLFRLPLACAAGYAVCVLPWMGRNYFALDAFALSGGYDVYILAQRAAYNLMSWSEWAVGWIYWLPDFGDGLAKDLFGEDAVRRLSFFAPDGFYLLGNGTFREEIMREAATENTAPLTYLLKEEILARPLKHVMVTFLLAWRGLWMEKYFGLLGVLLTVAALFRLRGTPRFLPSVWLLLPGVFMLGFHAFVSVSIPRYNLPLLFPMLMILSAYNFHSVGIRLFHGRSRACSAGAIRE